MKLKFEPSKIAKIVDRIDHNSLAEEWKVQRMCEYLNEHIEAYIKEHGVKVYGMIKNDTGSLWDNSGPNKFDTHQGILINVEKIESKKCEHKNIMANDPNVKLGFKCYHCGKNLAPTGWTEMGE